MIASPEFRPHHPGSSARHYRKRGISLLEVTLLIAIVALAVVPIVRGLGGPSSANGNAARVVSLQSRSLLLANTLIEEAMAHDFNSFNCKAGPFDPNNFPDTGTFANFPTSSRCIDNSYNQPTYYQWNVQNAAQANSLMPTGNEYYQAVLNVYNSATGGTPILTLPTSFFYNSSGFDTPPNKIGIVVIQDISGSMAWGQNSNYPVNGAGDSSPNDAVVSSPYLVYRYSDPAVNYTPPAAIALNWASGANAFNDQLDIVTAQNTDDPDTDWNDVYMGNGALGLGTTGGSISNCQSNTNWNSANWKNSQLYTSQYPYNNNTLRDTIIRICNRSPNWDTMMNDNMSRIEAARGSLLNFILSVEADSTLYQNTKLSFETFSAPNGPTQNNPSGLGYDVRVPLESVDANNRYPNMRRAVSWMNREGPGQINVYEGTHYTAPLRKAAANLFSDNTLTDRFILFLSDGAPNGPGDTHAQLGTLSTQIGNGTYPGSAGKTATIFTLGMMSDSPQMDQYLQNDMAQKTPGGQYFEAQNVGDVSGMFDQIKYQIQRVVLLNRANRYNVNFN